MSCRCVVVTKMKTEQIIKYVISCFMYIKSIYLYENKDQNVCMFPLGNEVKSKFIKFNMYKTKQKQVFMYLGKMSS